MELNARKYISRTRLFPNRHMKNFTNFLEFLKYKRALEFFTKKKIFQSFIYQCIIEIFGSSDGLTKKTNVWLTAAMTHLRIF